MNDEEDDKLLLNPIYLISQFEGLKNNNILKDLNNNIYNEQKSAEFQIVDRQNSSKRNASMNSNENTNFACDYSFKDNNINNNISFASFNCKQNREEKKELTNKSIEILNEFILMEEKINEIGKFNDYNKKINDIKICDITAEIKKALYKIDNNLNNYFKRPFMRKKYKENIIVEDDKEDEKISIPNEIKQNIKINEFDDNNLKEA